MPLQDRVALLAAVDGSPCPHWRAEHDEEERLKRERNLAEDKRDEEEDRASRNKLCPTPNTFNPNPHGDANYSPTLLTPNRGWRGAGQGSHSRRESRGPC